jgi:hypothetical protein
VALTDRYPISPGSRDPERATIALMVADTADRLIALAERCAADPRALAAQRETGDALAEQVGGDVALRWRITVVRALIAAPPDPDAVREAYGELVDRYRDDAAALATIKPLGDEIRRRESDGSLPSSMVVRSERRRTPTKRGF